MRKRAREIRRKRANREREDNVGRIRDYKEMRGNDVHSFDTAGNVTDCV